jgi:hypothetical protein|tara:strand:- start:2018 stop:2245 length:228 start_codon:yes stop_codon:yes gene_type:complete
MALNKERLSPERIEVIISGVLQEMPESFSMPEMRNLVVELLFGLGLHPNDLPFFMMMVVDAYMGDRHIDKAREGN